MEKIELTPIAFISNDRHHLGDDDWGEVVSEIHLRDDLSPELLMGLDTFSHVEVIFVFHRIPAHKKVQMQDTPATIRSGLNWDC